jgi:hypothetical protein
MDNQAIAELKRLFELQTESLMSVVDREVMHFLMNCEADGVKLENCPAYIREWMEREKD